MFDSARVGQRNIGQLRWNGARRLRCLRLLGNFWWGWGWRGIDNRLSAGDTPEVRGEETRRAAHADDRYCDRESKTVSHVDPARDALRLGRKARVAIEANSAAFI